jgi:hypothetical protein
MSTDEKLQKAVEKLEDVQMSLKIEIERLTSQNLTAFHLTELHTQVIRVLKEIQ